MPGATGRPRAARRLGSRAPGAPTASVSEATGRPPAGPGKLLGWGDFSAPQGLCQAPWAETRVGSLRVSTQRVTPAYLPAHGSWGGRRAQVACPLPLCRPLQLSQRLLGQRPCGRSHRKGRGAADPSRGHHSVSTRRMGRPPCKQQSLPPCSPPATLCPIPHPALGLGPPPSCQAHRGRAPGASGNRRSDALTEAAAAQGLNQRGSRTVNLGRGRDVSPEIHGLEGGARRPR